jgi:hypothetical protein
MLDIREIIVKLRLAGIYQNAADGLLSDLKKPPEAERCL